MATKKGFLTKSFKKFFNKIKRLKRFEDCYLLRRQPNGKSPSKLENQVFRVLLPYKDQLVGKLS
mgnify:FL=1